MSRTPTPQIDQIFSREQTVQRWHKLWLWHLEAQRALNPRHPSSMDDVFRYARAMQQFADEPATQRQWLSQMDDEEVRTRHELVAALNILNVRAQPNNPVAHLGLTSCDVTEVANQWAIHQASRVVTAHVAQIARQLADQVAQYAELKILARTHGQPAQLTTYGHRIATILGPLNDWAARWLFSEYPLRPPHGAVGTAADLMRVLANDPQVSPMASEATGSASRDPAGTEVAPGLPEVAERLEEYSETVRHGTGLPDGMLISRQTYHRSYDLHWVGLLAQLASIAETWATDRRLEAYSGWGCEAFGDDQVGSSAMPHKNNPRIAERICALAINMYAQLAQAAQHAGREWLEGDVSTSATRRELLVGAFRTADQILCNWDWAMRHWQIDPALIEAEINDHTQRWISGALMHLLVQRGVPRSQAHEALREARAHPRSSWRMLCEQFPNQIEFKDMVEVVKHLRDQPIGSVGRQLDRVISVTKWALNVELVPFGEPV